MTIAIGIDVGSGVMRELLTLRRGRTGFADIPAVPGAVVYDFEGRDDTTLFPDAVASRFERYEQALRRQTSPEEVNYLRLQFKSPVDRVVQLILDAETEDEVETILRQMHPPVAVLYRERLRDVQEFLQELPHKAPVVRLTGSWSDTLRALLIGSYSRYLAAMEA